MPATQPYHALKKPNLDPRMHENDSSQLHENDSSQLTSQKQWNYHNKIIVICLVTGTTLDNYARWKLIVPLCQPVSINMLPNSSYEVDADVTSPYEIHMKMIIAIYFGHTNIPSN